MSQPLRPNDGEALIETVHEPVQQPVSPPPEPGHEPRREPEIDPTRRPEIEPEVPPEIPPKSDPLTEPERAPVRDPGRPSAPAPVTDGKTELRPDPAHHPDVAVPADAAAPDPGTAVPVRHSTKRIPNSRATAVGDRIFAGIADPAPDVAVNPNGALILIADDEPNILISLEYLMKREGYRVSIARDGKQALESILSERPALVLLDVMMPKKSGFEVCQEVRANDTVSDTLILMLTAKGRDTDLAKGLGSGADAYMTKPFSTKELVVKVRAMLETRV